MGSPERNKSSLLQALCQELAQSLDKCSRSRWTVVAGTAEQTGSPDPATSAIFSFKVQGHLQGELFLALQLADLPQLDLNASDEAEHGAIDDVLAACAASLRTRLLGANAGDIECARVDAVDANNVLSNASLMITSEDRTKTFHIVALVGQTLIDSMDTSEPEVSNLATATPAANLDLVLDVELNVTLRFGQRQLPLRDVLELKSGAVVELDRQVDEPVELVLDGKVVALGEAVIIDGNYGIRITEVVQPLLAS